ncbi:MAG: 50S ribosomal protein L23 [Candidatus Zixiibacteriota bacterium]|nr:MAG: 50S ribosomal protein L23 [candidate division Zixibacteria bacterium]
MSLDPRLIIKSHITTERTTDLKEQNNEYVFEVDRRAGKHAIKLAVERAFGVKVEKVRTLIVPSKPKRMGWRSEGRRPSWKKAFVKLKKDQSISVFENV